MNKTLVMSLFLALSCNLIQTATTETYTPYYMKNADASKANAIKTNQANCGDENCGDCNVGTSGSIFATAQFISLQASANSYAKQHSCGCGNDNCGDDSIDLPSIK